MTHLRRPDPSQITAALSRQALTYPEVGATSDPDALASIPDRYDLDRHRFTLGSGHPLYERARASLLAWRHFDIPWLELHGSTREVVPDGVVATLVRVAGLWLVNPCRVVYIEGRSGEADETAFAYGTLPGHAEQGEERFSIRLDPVGGEVVYEVTVFSRPARLLSRIGYPWARRVQRRFVAASAEALARACGSEASLLVPPPPTRT